MEAFPRIALLGACIAAGVGVAVCLAMSLPAPTPAVGTVEPAEPVESAEPVAKNDAPPPLDETPPDPPLDPALAVSPPVPVPYDPPVTQETPPPSLELSKQEPDTSKWVSELIDLVRIQAEKSQPPVPVSEPVVEEEEVPPPPQPEPPPPPPAPEAEPLPEPASRLPMVTRDEVDDSLRVVVQNSDIRDVLELLSQQGDLNILATKSVTGTVSASLNGVDVESALLAILKSTGFVARREGKYIYVGTPEDFDLMDQTADVVATRVYRPNYIRAAELQSLITPLLTPTIGKVNVSTQSQIDIPSSQTETGGDMLAGPDVVIVKDFERVLLQIDQLVSEVDCRPRQVLIDAMILSVKLDDDNQFGINWQVLKDKAHVKMGLGIPPADNSGVDFTNGGLTLGYVDSTLTNFITALESIGETNVVASPRLLCLNKQRAEIQIGEQLGYVSTTVTETAATQSIQFLDVGTLLRIRPFIANDGTIRMEIHPELSTGTVDVDQGLTLPNKEVTQVTTNVMCQNGSTVVIGGLIREDLQTDTDQIPVLGDIPLIGPAFRQRRDQIGRQEILVVITPRLVDEPVMSQEGAKLGNDFLRRQSVVFDKMSPISRRHHGMQYLRKARAAWAAGDAKVALKYANLSIQHDPMSREAINLRDEVAAVAAPNESIHEYLKQGTRPFHRPHQEYSKDGSPWKIPDAFEPGIEPPDTWTPSEPGKAIRIDAPPAPPAAFNHAKRPATTKRK